VDNSGEREKQDDPGKTPRALQKPEMLSAPQ
jgi:hypothetical protein